MNISELETKLAHSSRPKNAYCLTGGLPNEAYCIEQRSDGKWNTYYSERGLRTGLKTFDTEDEACDYFFVTYVRDCEVDPNYWTTGERFLDRAECSL